MASSFGRWQSQARTTTPPHIKILECGDEKKANEDHWRMSFTFQQPSDALAKEKAALYFKAINPVFGVCSNSQGGRAFYFISVYVTTEQRLNAANIAKQHFGNKVAITTRANGARAKVSAF